MYECSICLSLNHAARIHCRVCGTIPAKYSFTGKPINYHPDSELGYYIVVATGAVHSCKHHAARVNLRTMPLDYYSEI